MWRRYWFRFDNGWNNLNTAWRVAWLKCPHLNTVMYANDAFSLSLWDSKLEDKNVHMTCLRFEITHGHICLDRTMMYRDWPAVCLRTSSRDQTHQIQLCSSCHRRPASPTCSDTEFSVFNFCQRTVLQVGRFFLGTQEQGVVLKMKRNLSHTETHLTPENWLTLHCAYLINSSRDRCNHWWNGGDSRSDNVWDPHGSAEASEHCLFLCTSQQRCWKICRSWASSIQRTDAVHGNCDVWCLFLENSKPGEWWSSVSWSFRLSCFQECAWMESPLSLHWICRSCVAVQRRQSRDECLPQRTAHLELPKGSQPDESRGRLIYLWRHQRWIFVGARVCCPFHRVQLLLHFVVLCDCWRKDSILEWTVNRTRKARNSSGQQENTRSETWAQRSPTSYPADWEKATPSKMSASSKVRQSFKLIFRTNNFSQMCFRCVRFSSEFIRP